MQITDRKSLKSRVSLKKTSSRGTKAGLSQGSDPSSDTARGQSGSRSRR